MKIFCMTHACATTHSYVPWLIRMCHDSFICAMTHSYVPWLIHMCHAACICAMTHFNEYGSIIQQVQVCLTQICAITHSYMPDHHSHVPQHLSIHPPPPTHSCDYVSIFPQVNACLTQIWAMTHSYEPWLIHMCHDSFICAITIDQIVNATMRLTQICSMPHSYVPWLIHMCHASSLCVSEIANERQLAHSKPHISQCVGHWDHTFPHIGIYGTLGPHISTHWDIWDTGTTHFHTLGYMGHWDHTFPHIGIYGTLGPQNSQCPIYEWGMSHVWMSHVTGQPAHTKPHI